MNDSVRLCAACGCRTSDTLCLRCEGYGLRPEMSVAAMLQRMTTVAATLEEEAEEEADDEVDGRDGALVEAAESWHKARACTNKDARQLQATEEDLALACRKRFEW